MPAASVAVYVLEYDSAFKGVNRNALPAPETVPATTLRLPSLNVKVPELTAVLIMLSLKEAEGTLSVAAHVEPFAGEVELTVGAVVSGAAPVVKVQTCAEPIALPATSRTPVVIVAV